LSLKTDTCFSITAFRSVSGARTNHGREMGSRGERLILKDDGRAKALENPDPDPKENCTQLGERGAWEILSGPKKRIPGKKDIKAKHPRQNCKKTTTAKAISEFEFGRRPQEQPAGPRTAPPALPGSESDGAGEAPGLRIHRPPPGGGGVPAPEPVLQPGGLRVVLPGQAGSGATRESPECLWVRI